MQLLLDTCAAIWSGLEPDQLSERARLLLEDPKQDLFLSVASHWEIELKYFSGRFEYSSLFLDDLCEELFIEPLAIEPEAIRASTDLPRIHADPFDRLIVAQAVTHNMAIVTPDEDIGRYPVPTVW